MTNEEFDKKWINIKKKTKKRIDANSTDIFVAKGESPETQRQFSLYNYFLFIREIIKNKNVKNFIELGCGRGTMSLYLNRYLNINATCSDASQSALDLAIENFKKYNGSADFILANSENLPLKENSFDLSVSIGLAEHFSSCDKLFREQYRILKPGGLMISLNIPEKFSIQKLNFLYKYLYSLVSGVNLEKDYFRNSFSYSDYEKFTREAGFKDVKSFHVNHYPIITPIDIDYDIRLTKLYLAIENLLSKHKKYIFSSPKFLSIGHFLIAEK